MESLKNANSADTLNLLERARAGEQQALNEIFTRHRERLRRMVDMRLDRRLQARVDPSDVVQEAYVDVMIRLEEYLREPRLPLFLWLRLVVGERLLKIHRHHLGTQMRDAGLEVSLYRGALPAASSAALAVQLLGKHTSPTQAATRAERALRLKPALGGKGTGSHGASQLRKRNNMGTRSVNPWVLVLTIITSACATATADDKPPVSALKPGEF
jgi:RNA polymerase sigma-70 factor (ECF subfamily)